MHRTEGAETCRRGKQGRGPLPLSSPLLPAPQEVCLPLAQHIYTFFSSYVQNKANGVHVGLGIRDLGLLSPALPLPNCVSWGRRLLTFLVLSLLICKMEMGTLLCSMELQPEREWVMYTAGA